MFRFVTLLALLGLALGFDLRHQLDNHWQRFKADHNKVYADEKEEAHRFQAFAQNFKFIQEHNARHENGEVSFWLAVNKFADLSFEEFSALYLNYKGAEKKPAPFLHNKFNVSDVPKAVDWRTKGIVTGVKDQGQCGSCWAFSTCASLEGAHAQSTGKLVSLSEQNLMDCSTKYGNKGCEGGLMDQGFQYIIANKGLDTEASYPYEGKDASCRFNAANVGATAKSFVDIPTKNENALLTASSERVVSVAIDASLFLQLYGGGVFNIGFLCSDDAGSLNHGVTVVGYGTQGSKDFWIVKNSWGATWGEKGYVRFARGKNLCGIATQASYPLV